MAATGQVPRQPRAISHQSGLCLMRCARAFPLDHAFYHSAPNEQDSQREDDNTGPVQATGDLLTHCKFLPFREGIIHPLRPRLPEEACLAQAQSLRNSHLLASGRDGPRRRSALVLVCPTGALDQSHRSRTASIDARRHDRAGPCVPSSDAARASAASRASRSRTNGINVVISATASNNDREASPPSSLNSNAP
jgi:hypothetical protein